MVRPLERVLPKSSRASYRPGNLSHLAVFMKSHLAVLETQETHAVLLAGMEYLVSLPSRVPPSGTGNILFF